VPVAYSAVFGTHVVCASACVWSLPWGLLPSQHRRRSIVFRVLFQQTNKQTNKQTKSVTSSGRARASPDSSCQTNKHTNKQTFLVGVRNNYLCTRLQFQLILFFHLRVKIPKNSELPGVESLVFCVSVMATQESSAQDSLLNPTRLIRWTPPTWPSD